jgi:serine acetyltransferase
MRAEEEPQDTSGSFRSEVRSEMNPKQPRWSQYLVQQKHQLRLILRIQRWLLAKNVPGATGLCGALGWLVYVLCGCEISPNAVVPRSVRFPHPTGIVIGSGSVLEDDVIVYQNVTLGSHGRPDTPAGYPSIGRGTILYAGAVIIGKIRVGQNCVIGANALVTTDVPDHSIATAPRGTIASLRGSASADREAS